MWCQLWGSLAGSERGEGRAGENEAFYDCDRSGCNCVSRVKTLGLQISVDVTSSLDMSRSPEPALGMPVQRTCNSQGCEERGRF